MDLSKIRINLIFKKKKERNKKHLFPRYEKSDVVSGLPSSPRYGMFTPYFINEFCPEKDDPSSMNYLFDQKNDSIIEKLQSFAKSTEIKEIKSKNGNSIEVKVPVNFDYSAYDIINMFAKDKELTTLCFNFLNKLIHKKLCYKKHLEQHERFLALILSRFDAFNYDLMAVPFAEHFYIDNNMGFKEVAVFEVLNVLISEHFCYRTHGTGCRKGHITLPDGIQYPRHYAEANYVPSLLIVDFKLIALINSFRKKLSKKRQKDFKKGNFVLNIFGKKIVSPYKPLDNLNLLDAKIVKKINELKKINSSDACVRRTREEFIQNISNLGFLFKWKPIDISNSSIKKEILDFYNLIYKAAFRFNFKYSTIIHHVVRHFKDSGTLLNYTPGSFKKAVQFVLYGFCDS